jgi:hypothetical protein
MRSGVRDFSEHRLPAGRYRARAVQIGISPKRQPGERYAA